MSVTSLISFKKAKEKERKKNQRLRVRMKPRYRGGKNVTFAMNVYQCCRCISPIVPGEEYRRDRYVRSYQTAEGEKSYFRYERYHLPDCTGPTEDEYQRMRDEVERAREAEERHNSRKSA